ncbi:MAG: hypothetical protein JXA53_08405, partial [Bacteroidales bacterium]|nr:hypothetical protein [Bacteroidales bacterium]
MTKEELVNKIKNSLDKLYDENPSLISRKLCERSVCYRFALYLHQEDFGEDYFVDCEYNKSHLDEGRPKMVTSVSGNYIDIVITKRTGGGEGDLACFETKRWNNYKNRKKDRENLKILSGKQISAGGAYFNYDFGVY